MKNPSCNGSALRAGTIATVIAIVLLMVSPATATPNAPAKLGNEVRVNWFTNNNQHYLDAARRPDGKWVVVWGSSNQDGSAYGAFMQMYNADRTPFRDEVQVNTYFLADQNLPVVAVAADNSFVVAYQSNQGKRRILSQYFDANGDKVGDEFRVTTGSGECQFADVTYLKNGDIVYVWEEDTTGHRRVLIRRYSPAFVPRDDVEDVAADGSPDTTQQVPRIGALNGGKFVVVYQSKHTGSNNFEVMAQIYNDDGSKFGSLFQVNTHDFLLQQYPTIAGLPNGGFIVAWESFQADGSGLDITVRHYAADGTEIGPEFIVHTYKTGHQKRPGIATFSDNSFVIAWYGPVQSGTGEEITLRHYDAAHNPVGSEVLVNTHATGNQWYPAVASNWADGDFGVFYASSQFESATSSDDIVAQWFKAHVVATVQTAPPCTSACLQYFCTEGKLLDVKVTGVVSNNVYGSAYFTDDSNLAAAAVFAGLVADGETATVTVKCSGPKPSFSSGSAHGVTTQAFASPWPASFTFDLGGQTHVPPPPSPERCFHEPCAQGKCVVQGTSFDIVVQGVASNNLWGTEEFSDDSWVASAAVHQGLLTAGSVGSVTVTCTGGRASLTGSTRNGVTSSDFGPWQFTYVVHAGPTAPPTPTADHCVGACLDHNCPDNRELYLRVFGTVNGYIWGGSAPYTADSTVSSAAVHAGLVSPGATAIVKATCLGAQSTYTGSLQNGVTTSSYGPWPASFALSAGTGMPTVVCGAGEQCLKDQCTVRGRVIKVSVTGSAHSTTLFWGDSLYTGDSPLSHAAVHAGLVQDGQTAVLYATCQGPSDAFAGTTANGLTSTVWNAPWAGSFTLAATL